MAVAALVLLLGVQLHRGEPMPPPSSTVMITVAPPPLARCYAVGFRGRPPRKLVDTKPVYPEAARARHVTGTVILAATIDEQGRVIRTEVVQHVEWLDSAAIEAVRQWRFAPATLDGTAVCVTISVAVSFP